MKYLLAVLALWSFGWGIYFDIVDKSQVAFQAGVSLGFLLAFVAILLAVTDNK